MRGRASLLLLLAASCNCGREISGTKIPFCAPTGPCDAPVFDADAGKCADAFAADGTVCDAGLICQTSTHCTAGACVGTPVSCDDSNACTQDTCLEGHGCQHAAITCGGDNPCEAYTCNPASGCYDTGKPAADGTACQLWWEPCVDDAACTAGTCDSPTADAETPGQVRWQLSLSNPIGPFTVDDAGTSTFLVSADGGPIEMVSIDACGRPRWTSNTGLDFVLSLMQSSGQFLVDGETYDGGQAALVLGLDPASGAQLWSVNLGALLAAQGLDAGCEYGGQMWPGVWATVAGTTDGATYALVNQCDEPNAVALLVALDATGRQQWVRQSPFSGGSPPALDSNGNIHVAGAPVGCPNEGMPQHATFWTVAPTGEPLEQPAPNVPIFTCDPAISLSVGPDVIALQGILGAFVNGDGGVVATGWWGAGSTTDAGTVGPFVDQHCMFDDTEAPLMDAEGNLFVTDIPPDAGIAGVTSLSASGEERWASLQISYGYLLISDDGIIFGLQARGNRRAGGVAALDANTGALQWSVPFPPAVPLAGPSLALTPGASLLTVSGSSATAIFAGKHRPSATAPWSRWGGDNSNRNAAR